MSHGYKLIHISLLSEQERALLGCMFRQGGGKYVPEHRLVIARSLGRPLTQDEVVHHANGVKDDNRLENLVLVSRSEHTLTHNDVRRKLVAAQLYIKVLEAHIADLEHRLCEST